MTKSLILAPLAILAFLSTSSPAEMQRGGASVQQPTAPQALLGDDDCEGPALGTVVIWNHFQSGLPTGHLQGRLLDGNRVIAQFAVRLEDDGDVTGTARTASGEVDDVEGTWQYDSDESEFEVEIELDGGFQYEVEGEFEGRRSFWEGEWERQDD